MKKIICLFLIATTLSLSSVHTKATQTIGGAAVIEITDAQLVKFYGAAQDATTCAILIGGLAVGGLLIGGAFGGGIGALIGAGVGASMGAYFCFA